MERKDISNLALRGVDCVLTVDPRSLELTDLYVRDTDLWRHLLDRFGGNKMKVTLRGPHDYKRGLRMPPDIVRERVITWLVEDGELDGIVDIVERIQEDEQEDAS